MSTSDYVVEALRLACQRAGSQTNFAKEAGVSVAYVNDVLQGRREPGKSICEALGFERRVTYVQKRVRKDAA